MSKSYYRVCEGITDKGKLIPEGSDFGKYVEGEAYVSAYKYNDKHKEIFEKTGTIAGITDVVGDDLYFDLDSSDLEKARKDTIEVVNRLTKKGLSDENIKVYFSGRKGFHVSVKTDKNYTPVQFKNLALKIAGDLDTFDSVIYNPSRVIRMEGALHSKSNLRKTLLTLQELNESTIKEIKDIAKELYEFEKPSKVKLPKSLEKLMVREETKETKSLDMNSMIDLQKNPLDLSPWKNAISQGYFPDGQRSNSLMILASTLKNKGLVKEQCYYYLKASSDLQSRRYGNSKLHKKDLWSIVDQVFKPTWNNGCYSEENFPTQLQTFFDDAGIPRIEEKDLMNEKYSPTRLSDIGEVFENFVLNYDKNVIKTGIGPLDKDMPLTPGMNLGIIGAPGAGKTACALKILQYCSKNNIHAILASIDMNSTRLYEKVLYRITGLSREELYDKFKNGDAEEIKDQVRELFKTVYVYDKSACTIDDLRKYHKAIEKRDGVTIKMTMVDYFERVNSDVSDDTASSKKVAGEWQDYINDFNVVGVMFVQPNKMGLSGGANTPILEYTKIKGSSFLYQSFRGILSLWRPFYTPETKDWDRYMQMAILKNDLGKLNMYDFGWDGKRGEIREMDDSEKRLFKQLMEEKADSEDEGY